MLSICWTKPTMEAEQNRWNKTLCSILLKKNFDFWNKSHSCLRPDALGTDNNIDQEYCNASGINPKVEYKG